MSCSCPQPSSANLLKNPGFDTDLSNWNVTSGDGSITWANADATSCPYSGSVYVTSTDSAMGPRLWQCVPISPSQSAFTTPYYWGLRAKGLIGCDIDAFFSPNCTGSSTSLASGVLWVNGSWSSISPAGSIDVGLDVSSIRLSCYVPSDYPNGTGYVDKFYFSSTSGDF
jgi:hypothetical protein